ncbi:MAG: hypothetical protein N2323_07670 [candidate division WOR-3 bacterium]|nr:hypothetical protein [candidate division WOR-3 bacterium]
MEDRKELNIVCRGLLSNSPITIKANILPVDILDYKNCVKEMELFVFYLINNADVSLSIRLLVELFKKLPGFFPEDLKPLIEKWYKDVEEKEKGKRGIRG